CNASAARSSRCSRGSLSDSKTASGRDETASGRDPGSGIRESTVEDLMSAARRTRENARADFSHFKVGTALEASDGTIITGCNIENATYGLTICAERVALFKALSDGH